MSQTLDQIFISNPITSNLSSDLMYFSRSPYSTGHDAAMTYSSFAAQFVAAGLPVLLAPSQSQTITGAFNLLLSSGNLIVGASSAPLTGIGLQIVGLIGSSGASAVFTYHNASDYANFDSYKSASNTIGVYSAIGTAEAIGGYSAWGDDGTQFTRAAAIRALSDGTVSNGIVPGQWQFFTANSSGVLTLGMTLDSSQNLTTFGIHKAVGQPAFSAAANSNISNVTGDGTNYTVIFSSVNVNNGSNYNATTGLFTAPVSGIYNFTAVVGLTGVVSGVNTNTQMIFQQAGSATLTSYFYFDQITVTGTTIVLASGAFTIFLTAGDTMSVQVQSGGGTKVVSVLGTPSLFGGYLIG